MERDTARVAGMEKEREREREGRVEKEIEAMWLGLGEVVVRSMGKGGIKDRERGVKKP